MNAEAPKSLKEVIKQGRDKNREVGTKTVGRFSKLLGGAWQKLRRGTAEVAHKTKEGTLNTLALAREWKEAERVLNEQRTTWRENTQKARAESVRPAVEGVQEARRIAGETLTSIQEWTHDFPNMMTRLKRRMVVEGRQKKNGEAVGKMAVGIEAATAEIAELEAMIEAKKAERSEMSDRLAALAERGTELSKLRDRVSKKSELSTKIAETASGEGEPMRVAA